MPAALRVDWSGIRAANVAGATLEQLSQQTGISLGTLKARSMREGWTTHAKAIREALPIHATSMQPCVTVDATTGKLIPNSESIVQNAMQPSATSGADAMAKVLKTVSDKTRLCISTAAHKMAAQAAKDPKLANANELHSVAKTAGLIHGWEAKQSSPAVMVNLQILGL